MPISMFNFDCEPRAHAHESNSLVQLSRANANISTQKYYNCWMYDDDGTPASQPASSNNNHDHKPIGNACIDEMRWPYWFHENIYCSIYWRLLGTMAHNCTFIASHHWYIWQSPHSVCSPTQRAHIHKTQLVCIAVLGIVCARCEQKRRDTKTSKYITKETENCKNADFIRRLH